MQVVVRDNNIDQALKALKKKLQREGVFREMKLRRHYEKPSERRAREAAEAVRRARKVERKRLEREGFIGRTARRFPAGNDRPKQPRHGETRGPRLRFLGASSPPASATLPRSERGRTRHAGNSDYRRRRRE